MRILWIGKAPGDGTGDEIFDRSTIASLRADGHEVAIAHPRPLGRAAEALNLARGLPVYRARFASRDNRRHVAAATAAVAPDLTICSWEPFDILVPALRAPVILIAHNVTGAALPSIHPGNPAIAVAAYRARQWERRVWRHPKLRAVAVLSRADRDLVNATRGVAATLLTIPGMPPVEPLAPDAALRRVIAIDGTYTWGPKRRDLARFAREFADRPDRFAIAAGALPAGIEVLLGGGSGRVADPDGAALAFGLITDRFVAGHKLKTLAYLARNRIVLSFADVRPDFADIPDAAWFIRTITAPDDIAPIADELARVPPDELRRRFNTFRDRCAAKFTWTAVARALTATVDRSAAVDDTA